MPRTKEPDFYVARTSGVIKVNGKVRLFTARQTIVASDDPIVARLPDAFVPFVADRQPTTPERA